MKIIHASAVEEAFTRALHADEERDFYGRSSYSGYREADSKDRWIEAEELEAAYKRQWWVRLLRLRWK